MWLRKMDMLALVVMLGAVGFCYYISIINHKVEGSNVQYLLNSVTGLFG